MDTETTEKNLEDKCKEMDDKLSFSDKKLKEEIEKNEVLTNGGRKLKTELGKSAELKKENVDLKLKVEEALKKESGLLMTERAVLVDKTIQTKMETLEKGFETEVIGIEDCDNTNQGKEVSEEKETLQQERVEDDEETLDVKSEELLEEKDEHTIKDLQEEKSQNVY